MIRLFEAFAGVGSQSMALRNIGADYETVAISEIDKFAIASYEAIHGAVINLGDISQIETETIPDHDLFTYSFPCQDISVAGKQGGLSEGTQTRSSLLWECKKVIETKKPKYLLLENVKNLVGKRHKANFELWLDWLVAQGYTNYWKVLNAQEFGVPQNRERVFVVSVLGEHKPFEFPEPQELSVRLKDLLENEVDEKYFINRDWVYTVDSNLPAHDTNEIAQLTGISYKATRSITDPDKICRCLDTMGGGQREPKVLIKNATKLGYLEAFDGDGIDLSYPNSKTRRGRVQKECRTTLLTSDTVGTLDNLRIRKLTPLECWRLMGFSDTDFYKAEEVNSNSQLYKQSGNSIVVNVLEGIFRNMLATSLG